MTMDRDEQELFTATVRAAVSGADSAAALEAALVDLGWADAFEVDPRTAVSALFEAQGEVTATSTALGIVVGAALGVSVEDGAGLVLPTIGHDDPPGRTEGTCVPVKGLGLSGLLERSRATVVATGADGALHLAAVDLTELEGTVAHGLDPDLGLVVIGVDCVTTAEPWAPADGSWDEAVAAGRRALAHELLGTMRTMLRLAREHALERIQFGQPIARFQAVRHKLAEVYVAVEATEAAIDAAWQDGTPAAATLAKVVAGTNARIARTHCQQVLAGIGFTTEHDLHRSIKRSLVLDGLLGDARTLTTRVGAELLEARKAPAITPL
jgi:hypothetical protein